MLIEGKPFYVRAKHSDQLVRPQITVQVSLEEIPQVFERLATLGHVRVNDFLICLKEESQSSSSTQESVLSEKNKKFKNFREAIDKTRQLKALFREKFSNRLDELKSTRVKGFSYLFLYYWYEIFNDKKHLSAEQGLKAHLALMSRIPFSQMYDEDLSEDEKNEFRFMFEGIISSFGKDQYRIREYLTYDGKKSENGITIIDWFNSIIDKDKEDYSQSRQHASLFTTVEEDTDPSLGFYSPTRKVDRWVDCLVDLLSPPSDLISQTTSRSSHSMGAIHRDKTKGPLIEVRGYSGLQYNKTGIQIDNVKDFIEQEANWFFDLRK